MILTGFALPYSFLNEIKIVGIKHKPEVFIKRKVIISSEATLELPFKSSNSFIAFNPKGVAAEPIDIRLATKFKEMYCIASLFRSSFLKRGCNKKEMYVVITCNNPLLLQISSMPPQKINNA